MKQKKTLSALLTTKLLLIVRDEVNFAEKATFRFNYVKLILLIGLTFTFCLVISFVLVTTVLNQWFDPRVDYLKTNRTLIELEEKIDSLDFQVQLKDQYINNFKNVLEGRADFSIFDAPVKNDSVKYTDIDLSKVHPIDSQFRKEFEEFDYEQLSYKSNQDDLQHFFFFTPATGIISRNYSLREKHFGIDIVAQKNEPIKAIADGTVILASWTQDSGHVIGVQHKNRLISLYKHNSTLLKKVGETIKAGEIVAIIGNSGEFTDGPHLHFELWHNGNPVNPEDFIAF